MGSPIHRDVLSALHCGNWEHLGYMASQNLNINEAIEDANLLTPLHYACMLGRFEMVRYLCEYLNANVNVVDSFQRTPLIYAAQSGHIKIVDYLLRNTNASSSLQDVNGWTAAQFAAFHDHHEVLQALNHLSAKIQPEQ